MTIKPEENASEGGSFHPLSFSPETYVFEQLFVLGYAESQPISVYTNGNIDISVVVRTLTPVEIRDVLEICGQLGSQGAQSIVERIETLARGIVTINHAPLVLTKKEQQDFYEKYNRSPSPLDMARIILNEKIKSLDVIDLIYEAYVKFTNSVTKDFEKAKKK